MCNGDVFAGTACTQCEITLDPRATACTSGFSDHYEPQENKVNKSKTVREGDYVWFRGKKRLWRTLGKHERKVIIKELKEDQKENKSFVKRKQW